MECDISLTSDMTRKSGDTRYEIFKTIVSSKKMLTISEISKCMHTDQERVSYHIPYLVSSGSIIKDGYNYFAQPIFLDESLTQVVRRKVN